MQTNRRSANLSAVRASFTAHRMLNFPTWQPRIPHPVPSDNDEDQSGAAEEDAVYNEVFLAQTHGTPRIYSGLGYSTDYFDDSFELSTQPPRPWSED